MNQKANVTQHFDDYAATWSQKIRQHGFYARFLVVKRMVEGLPKPALALDVGCGTGDYCVLFEPRNYVGLDISSAMVARCIELYPGYRFDVADGDRLKFADGAADIILDVAVIEYYEDALPHLRELARVIRPGGSVIVVAPNGDNITRPFATLIDKAIGVLKGRGSDQSEKAVSHRRRTAGEVAELAAQVGLKLVDRDYASIYLIPEFRPALHRINEMISAAISGKPALKWFNRWAATNMILQFRRH